LIKAVGALHQPDICAVAGFISGFDHATPQSIEQMADRLLDISVDVPLLSILTLTSFKGIPSTTSWPGTTGSCRSGVG
jgi:hypothetical protein